MTLSRTVVVRAAVSVCLALGGGGGCGLISSDITSVKFDLPERSYSFDTAQAGLTVPPGLPTFPSIDSPDAASCCGLATVLIPGIDCTIVTWDEATATCSLTKTVETPPQMVDLKKEVSALSSFSSQSVIDVTISKITYDITRNTLNTDLPPVELFVAAQGALTTADPTAKRFGTVPATRAGMTLVGGLVAVDPQGQEAFKAFAHNFGTPFVFLARTTVGLHKGDPLPPQGAISLTIKGQLKANAGL